MLTLLGFLIGLSWKVLLPKDEQHE